MSIVGKYELVKAIAAYHPGYNAGKSRGYSYYTGGMADTGGWNILKMMEADYAELRKCLIDLEAEAKPQPMVVSQKYVVMANTVVKINQVGVVTTELEADCIKKLNEKLHSTLLWGTPA